MNFSRKIVLSKKDKIVNKTRKGIIMINEIEDLLGDEAQELLEYEPKISKENLHLPGPDFVDRVFADSDRNARVQKNLQDIFDHGRLGGTGYMNLLPVDQAIEHSASSAFAPNPKYFDPENIVKLAIEGGCNGVASTLGVLGSVAEKYAHKIPFILKINHNELLSIPQKYDQKLFASVDQAFNMGASAIGATIYFGSPESNRQIQEISKAFEYAHELGMGTILWCYLRNSEFDDGDTDYHKAADMTGQANHIGATIEADIVKQKQAENNGGFTALNFGYTDDKVYSDLTSDHPVDLTRYQVANSYMGRIGLINSGGASSGEGDLADVVRTSLINKLAGGMGMITGRKAFQRPMEDGIDILHKIQDVYLSDEIEVA